jgi:hypothetical protein
MSGYLKGEVSIGLVGCRREWEIDLPEDWDELDRAAREDWKTEVETEMLHEYAEVWSEVISE